MLDLTGVLIVLLLAVTALCICKQDSRTSSIILACIIAMLLYEKQNRVVPHDQSNYRFSNSVSASKASAYVDKNLNSTPNPAIAGSDPSAQREKDKVGQEAQEAPKLEKVTSHMNAKEYTSQGIQEKYENRVFRSELQHRQSSDSRARLLNSLYSDMLTENVKQDPYLRKTSDSNCETIKGRRQRVEHNDC